MSVSPFRCTLPNKTHMTLRWVVVLSACGHSSWTRQNRQTFELRKARRHSQSGEAISYLKTVCSKLGNHRLCRCRFLCSLSISVRRLLISKTLSRLLDFWGSLSEQGCRRVSFWHRGHTDLRCSGQYCNGRAAL